MMGTYYHTAFGRCNRQQRKTARTHNTDFCELRLRWPGRPNVIRNHAFGTFQSYGHNPTPLLPSDPLCSGRALLQPYICFPKWKQTLQELLSKWIFPPLFFDSLLPPSRVLVSWDLFESPLKLIFSMVISLPISSTSFARTLCCIFRTSAVNR